jgi:hypothetical protein
MASRGADARHAGFSAFPIGSVSGNAETILSPPAWSDMKNILISLIVALALSSTSAHAQLGTVGNNTIAGAALGGIAGAVIGNNSRGHDSAKGALIGVAAGGLIGAVVGQQKVINRSQSFGLSAPPQVVAHDRNPYAWEPSRPGYGQWVQSPPDHCFPHDSGRSVVVVQADPFAEMDARIAAARSEAEAAQRNAESLQRALDQARETAYAAERRANELTRLRRGYATNSYR